MVSFSFWKTNKAEKLYISCTHFVGDDHVW